MKTDIDYKDDPRWKLCNEALTLRGAQCPNYFASVLLHFVEHTKLQKYKLAFETGTFEGQTTEIFAELFDYVSTVEKYVDSNPYRGNTNMKNEFYNKLTDKYSNINFYSGDSPIFLDTVLRGVNTPCVFLLDAHDGSTSPLREELKTIKSVLKTECIIVIDDTVDVGTGNWPSTSELNDLLLDINPNFDINYTGWGRNILIAQ